MGTVACAGNSVGGSFCANPDIGLSHLPVVEFKNTFPTTAPAMATGRTHSPSRPRYFLDWRFRRFPDYGERLIHLRDGALEHYRSARNAGFRQPKAHSRRRTRQRYPNRLAPPRSVRRSLHGRDNAFLGVELRRGRIGPVAQAHRTRGMRTLTVSVSFGFAGPVRFAPARGVR